jgi:hypothetical protein
MGRTTTILALAIILIIACCGCQWSTTWSRHHLSSRIDVLTPMQPTATQPAIIPWPTTQPASWD